MAPLWALLVLGVPQFWGWRANLALLGFGVAWLYGLGEGLVSDAGVRLFCWVSEPAHVIVALGTAILVLMAIGSIAATIVARLRK